MQPFGGFEIFGLLLIVLAAVALWSTVKIVPQGYNWTIENFGRYTRTLTPGLHILIPVMERVGYKMNMKEQVMEIPSQDVITRDVIDSVAFLDAPQVAELERNVDLLDRIIDDLEQERGIPGFRDEVEEPSRV